MRQTMATPRMTPGWWCVDPNIPEAEYEEKKTLYLFDRTVLGHSQCPITIIFAFHCRSFFIHLIAKGDKLVGVMSCGVGPARFSRTLPSGPPGPPVPRGPSWLECRRKLVCCECRLSVTAFRSISVCHNVFPKYVHHHRVASGMRVRALSSTVESVGSGWRTLCINGLLLRLPTRMSSQLW